MRWTSCSLAQHPQATLSSRRTALAWHPYGSICTPSHVCRLCVEGVQSGMICVLPEVGHGAADDARLVGVPGGRMELPMSGPMRRSLKMGARSLCGRARGDGAGQRPACRGPGSARHRAHFRTPGRHRRFARSCHCGPGHCQASGYENTSCADLCRRSGGRRAGLAGPSSP